MYTTFNPPDFSCPGGGTPNSQCMAFAASVYQSAMRQAWRDFCLAEQAIEAQYDEDMEACQQAFLDCMSQDPPPGNCIAQLWECQEAALAAAQSAWNEASNLLETQKVMAQDAYFAMAVNCCP